MDDVLITTGPYKLRKLDFLAFQKNAIFKKEVFFQNIKTISLFGIIIGIIEALSSHLWLKSIFNSILAMILFGIFFQIIMIAINLFGKNTKKLCKTDIEIHVTENSVSGVQDDNSSSYAWRNVDCIRQTETHIFLYVTPFCAYVIPKKIFSDKNETTNFINIISKKLAESKNNPASQK